MPAPLIAPSILSADFARLGDEVRAIDAAGADWIHIDVMDGHFVPNLTIGPGVVKALRPHTAKPFDVHLMISPVDAFIEAFAAAGADTITVHPEAGPHIHRTIQAIKSLGKKAGVSLNPGTPAKMLDYLIDEVDLVLVMSVNPGFGGQSSSPASSRRSRRCARCSTRAGATSVSKSTAGSTSIPRAKWSPPAPTCWSPGPRPSAAGPSATQPTSPRSRARGDTVGEQGSFGLLAREGSAKTGEARAVPLNADGTGDASHVDREPRGPEMLEPGRALALADFAPPSLGAGERLVRLAYKLGVPGTALRSPFRKAAKPRLLATVANPLSGQRAAGQAMRAGWLQVYGGRLALADLDYASKAITPPFERALHRFAWLDDLAASAPREAAAPVAERLLAHWLAAFPAPGKGPAWSVGNAGHRVLAWLVHAPLLIGGRDKTLRANMLTSLATTARWLDRHVHKGEDRLAEVAGWSAIVAAGLLLPDGKPRRLYGEAGLLRALGDLVGDDGGVLSRSPLAQIEAIELLVRLTGCYRATRRDPPEAVAGLLSLLVPPLLGVLHGDGSLGNWQGAGAIEASRIEALVAASEVRARPLREARQWGYQRVSAGPPRQSAVLVVDAAPPPLARHARDGCASTLAFELSAGKQRLIVNCGGAAFAGGAIPVRLVQGLRATAAHSTLVLDDSNSTAVLINGKLGAGVSEVEVDRRQVPAEAGKRGATRIEAAHDGYVPRFGLTHRRILLLADDGGELRGEDLLVPSGRRGKRGKVSFAIRFHLAPGVEPYLSEDGRGVALALPDGSHWQFRSGANDEGVRLSLDDSLWADGQGRPQATRQIVVAGMISRGGGSFPWLLKRMG